MAHKGFPLSVRLLMTPYEQLKAPTKGLKTEKGNINSKSSGRSSLVKKSNEKLPSLSVLLSLRNNKFKNLFFNLMSSETKKACLYENVCEVAPKIINKQKTSTDTKQGADFEINDQNLTCCKIEIEESKKLIYKNPEYHCYHSMSYYNFQVELSRFRLPESPKDGNITKKVTEYVICEHL